VDECKPLALGCFGVHQSWVYSVMWYAPGMFWALGPSNGEAWHVGSTSIKPRVESAHGFGA